jgi:hypothetical protein
MSSFAASKTRLCLRALLRRAAQWLDDKGQNQANGRIIIGLTDATVVFSIHPSSAMRDNLPHSFSEQ